MCISLQTSFVSRFCVVEPKLVPVLGNLFDIILALYATLVLKMVKFEIRKDLTKKVSGSRIIIPNPKHCASRSKVILWLPFTVFMYLQIDRMSLNSKQLQLREIHLLVCFKSELSNSLPSFIVQQSLVQTFTVDYVRTEYTNSRKQSYLL
jgi:hypothetical protein